MTFYQELQLSSAGSKQLIHKTTNPQEKRRHILVYNFKVYLVMAFCVAVVSLFSRFLGSENSVVGVTVLLAVLVLRQADFGIRTTHGLWRYCPPLCDSHDRSTSGKYASSPGSISGTPDLHPSADDSRMS